MATYNGENSTTTFVATPVHNSAGPFATAASHFITTSTPSSMILSNPCGATSLHRQTTAAVTSNSTSSSYTFLQIKREPCQVSEVTTSNHCHQQQQQQLTASAHHHHQQQQHHHGVCSATSSTSISAGSKTMSASTLTTLVKIEPPSPKIPDLLDKGSATGLGNSTNNSVPIGIAVARKRPQETSAPSLANCSSTAIPLSQTLSKDLNCFGIRVADFGGVGSGCGNIFFTGNGDLMTGSTAATAEELALQSVNRAPSTIWQYPSAALPFESVISMSPATVGLQYSREASRAAGQVVLLPAATAAALGISNIPPICYTPTDPFQQAAAAAALVWPSAAAYLPQGTATAPPTAASLQAPHNFIFPTMNSAHTAAAAAAAAATLQPQSYAAAASLQLFGSSYLRNATEFMAAANKTSTTTQQQSHMIAGAAPTSLTMPPSQMGALSFETRDKTTMTTTTTTNLLELQGNTQTALNLIRLPTPPTSATIGDSGHNVTAAHLHTTPRILFQTAMSPAPTLLNLSTTGQNISATTATAAALPRTPAPCATGHVVASNSFLNNNATVIGPPTPVGDELSTTTNAPLALNFNKTTAGRGTDATNNPSIVVGVPRGLANLQSPLTNGAVTTQPQMQDVNIQTDTPVCSEDENSSCPLAALQQQQQQQHQTSQFFSTIGNACLTTPPYNCSMSHDKIFGNDEITEPLELTKARHDAPDGGAGGSVKISCNNETEPQIAKGNAMCHNKDEISHIQASAEDEMGKRRDDETNTSENIYAALEATTVQQQQQKVESPQTQTIITSPATYEAMCTASTAADDFAGLELLSNISSLANKPANLTKITETKTAAMLRVKQEPLDAVDEILPQQEQLIVPTISAKIEHIGSVATHHNNNIYEREPHEALQLSMPTAQSSVAAVAVAVAGALEPPSAAEPLGGLKLLCALAEQRIQEEEQEEQSGNFFTSSSENQRSIISSFGPFHEQQMQQQSQILRQQPTPFGLEQSSFPSMDGIELPCSNNVEASTAAVLSSPGQQHIPKRKKHKHSKSSKSSKSSTTSTSSTVALANGIVSPSVLLCGVGKSSKRSSKKNKKKYSKEKKRQQRAEAAAAAAAVAAVANGTANELDFEDDQLQEELHKAFMSGSNINSNGGSSSRASSSSNVKWPSAQEIFNIMESRMRERLADINRQYRKKKRKLDEISKTQRKRKKCSKLIAQQLQLQQQMQLQQQQQQNLLSSPLTAATLSLNSSSTTTNSLGDYKFTTTKFTTPSATATSAPGSGVATTSPYLQPSSFPLRFPPLSASTADEDSDKNSHTRTNKRNPIIYKTVRLEPSSLSAAMIANGAAASNNNNSNSSCSNSANNNNSTINNNNSNNSNSNGSTNGIDTSNFSINTALRLAQKHAAPIEAAALVGPNSKERKLMPKENLTKRSTLVVGDKGNSGKIKKSKSAKAMVTSNGSSATLTAEQRHPRSEADQELTLTNEHLYRNETRVLTDMGGLFYAGIMKPLQPPDIYAITLDGERGNKPHIMSREEIFKDTILEIAPKSVDSVPVGTRLCAYWSQQYRCLYPGRAIESESSEGDEISTEKDFVSVEFDDGDSGRIRLHNIRLLLSDYPIVEYNDNPLYSLGKQKKSGLKNGGNHITSNSPILSEGSTAAHIFETKLGQTSMLAHVKAVHGDTEMYARRTEKKRLKKNPKKKSGMLKNNISGNAAILATANSGENIEHNRKHHKHKKHKKHKKHHRKFEEADGGKTFTVHMNSDVNDIAVDHLERLKVQEVGEHIVEQNHQNQPQTQNTSAVVSLKPIKLESNNTLGGVRVKTEQLEDIEEESASNMMSENSDEVKGDDDDEVEHNNSKGSKIAAFLPERQLWGWLGTAYRKAGVKGRARKQFYKTIKRGKELITVGDCAVFLSTGRPDRPYIGRIESMWETASSNKVVRVRWFYHPEETTGCPNLKYPGALFESPHEDENDVQTISHRCEVLPFERYFDKFGADTKQYQSIYDNNDTYYLAGYYNPKVQALTLQEKIPTTATAAIISNNNTSNGSKVNKGGEKKHMNTSTGTSIP